MSGDHDHSHGAARSGNKRTLALVVAMLAVFMVAEIVGGLLTNSLALLSDAGHMFTDVLGMAMALAAMHLADRGRSDGDRTFGLYRLEILAALANAVLLFGVAVLVLVEAVRRLDDPHEVLSTPMLVLASLGLAANIVAFLVLRSGAKQSLNMEGAYLEVLADAVGSVGVIAAAVVIAATGWDWVDPAAGVAIGVFILPRTWRLGARALRILVQAAPAHVDLEAVRADLGSILGVVDVHDLHVWTLTSDMEVATAHLMVGQGIDQHAVLDRARSVLRDNHQIEHATVQVEPDDHLGCDEIHW